MRAGGRALHRKCKPAPRAGLQGFPRTSSGAVAGCALCPTCPALSNGHQEPAQSSVQQENLSLGSPEY
ncbi:hypothetical protein IEO21_07040 [Rhodonia placenta]|uniref:Uncharacterized protein n=2 Tax=Rhodonia placenta TaxID=104341 RepID=A0A1X6N2L3_9APHY|nr:hypothetical protein POSPLADRAFT_1039772 [Postia placenta MAD-698-R-SB12]KAF9810272.1 hypothetical protein IEO21_07040 [Postia placenta]OSX62867.1 hypothetical protein POSPLADRAFT_1039772 [Postia placenta MAD-698-R-SB12]